MKRLSIALALVAAIGFSSCTEESTTTPTATTTVNLPMKAGNYWIYNTYELDSITSAKSGTPSIDSMYCVGEGTYNGKKSSMFITDVVQFPSPVQHDTSYFYSDGSKLYEWMDFSGFALPGVENFVAPTTWALIADADATGSWTILNQTVPKVKLELNGSQVELDVTIKVNAQKGTTAQYTVAGSNRTAQEYVVTTSITASSLEITTIKAHYFYIPNYGLAEMKVEPAKIGFSGVTLFRLQGSLSELQRLMVQ